MKKYFRYSIIIGAVFLLLLFSGCQKYTRLTVWSFDDELAKMIDEWEDASAYYRIDYSVTPDYQFQKRLDPVLASGRGAPDVFALDSAFVRKYVESGLLLDLSDIYEKNKDKLIAYPAQVGTYEDKIYAMSWQVNPGAMFYRRSLARRYLGTDNPQIIQTYFADFGRFLNSARLLKTRSNGTCVAVASYKDLQIPILSARKEPWVVNERLSIDPILDYYFNFAKELYENKWEGRVDPNTEGWYAGISGDLKDENGRPVEVFSYFISAKNFQNGFVKYADSTEGDWAMIQGPAGWYRGGSWIAARKGTKNPEGVIQMIEWLTTDDEFLKAYAIETGEIVSNFLAVDEIKENFENDFLGGQNQYVEFIERAKTVSGKLAQNYDDEIQVLYIEAINAFVKGEKSKQQSIEDFKVEAIAKMAEINENCIILQ